MRKRALDQERTRQKIVDAAVELHGTVGPKKTSISAVAERAGVQRLTVYRHFPDEFALFAACSSHWLSRNPPPEPEEWQRVAEPSARTARALSALYRYYSNTASMWRRVYRDGPDVEALHEPLAGFHDYLDEIRDDLLTAWQPKGRKPATLRAAIGHALSFSTWSSLSEKRLSHDNMVALVLRWIDASR